MKLSIKIIGGLVFDGSGEPPRRTDIGVSGEYIMDRGDLSQAEADITIDARDRFVCPGFIDAHSHSDTYLLIEPSAPSKIFQGITTEVVGNCGASAAPLCGDYKMPSDWLDKEYPSTWSTVREYRELLEKRRPAPNTLLLIGHNTLRAGVMGYDPRPATPDELDRMKKSLRECLDDGGSGFSTGLAYSPGMFAPVAEITELASVTAEAGGLYTSHMRSEGARLIESIEETIAVGREAGCRVQISHLKTTGRAHWGYLDKAFDHIRSARAVGLPVGADRYPYTASCTDLDIVFPDWAAAGGRDAVLKRLRTPSERTRLREQLLHERPECYWETITIGSTSHPENRRFQGMPLLEVAKALDAEPVDAVLHLTDTDNLMTGAFFFGMSEENMWRIMAEPYVMFGSDASLRATEGPLSHDHPHPRAYGSLTRFLRAAVDARTVNVTEAIRKMTSLPATQFRLERRGLVERGMYADLVVFDPETLEDKSTYAAPHQLSTGVEHVIVNGVHTLADGALTGNRGGRFVQGL